MSSNGNEVASSLLGVVLNLKMNESEGRIMNMSPLLRKVEVTKVLLWSLIVRLRPTGSEILWIGDSHSVFVSGGALRAISRVPGSREGVIWLGPQLAHGIASIGFDFRWLHSVDGN